MTDGVHIRTGIIPQIKIRSLDGILEPICQEIRTINFPRESITTACIAIEDHNVVHKDPEIAGEFGFFRNVPTGNGEYNKVPDTPLVGTAQTAAFGERFATEKLAQISEAVKHPALISHWDIRMPHGAYPDESIEYKVTPKTSKNTLESLQVTGSTNGDAVVKLIGTVSEVYSSPPDPSAEHKFQYPYPLFQKRISRFYQGANIKPTPEVANMHIAGYITSAILELIRVKTLERKGSNLRMRFDVIKQATPEVPVEVFVYPYEGMAHQKRGLWIYNMPAVAKQDDKPIMFGQLRCGTEQYLNNNFDVAEPPKPTNN